MTERTVCVWDRGGVHSVGDTTAFEREIAEALGAGPESVEITIVRHDDRGVWFHAEIFAPDVPADWAGASQAGEVRDER